MQEFIAYIVKNLVEKPDEVQVEVIEGQAKTLIEVRVAKEDIAKVVGRGGRTINAIRTISFALGARLGKRIHLELLD